MSTSGKVQVMPRGASAARGASRILAVGGKVATANPCCYQDACNEVNQPDCVVSLSGTCGYGCDSAGGTYDFLDAILWNGWIPQWRWKHTGQNNFLIIVRFDREHCQWLVWIYGTVLYQGQPYEIQFGDPEYPISPSLIDCDPETGFIVGDFHLPGQWLTGSYDCHLCVAHVTLG